MKRTLATLTPEEPFNSLKAHPFFFGEDTVFYFFYETSLKLSTSVGTLVLCVQLVSTFPMVEESCFWISQLHLYLLNTSSSIRSSHSPPSLAPPQFPPPPSSFSLLQPSSSSFRLLSLVYFPLYHFIGPIWHQWHHLPRIWSKLSHRHSCHRAFGWLLSADCSGKIIGPTIDRSPLAPPQLSEHHRAVCDTFSIRVQEDAKGGREFNASTRREETSDDSPL